MNRVLFYAPIVDDPLGPPSSGFDDVFGEESVGVETTPAEEMRRWREKHIRWRVENLQEANLVSSYVDGGESLDGDGYELHAPVLDLDHSDNPVGVCAFIGNWLRKRGYQTHENDFMLIPSSTEGHFHLYIDVALPWPTYSELLVRLGDEKILEDGYVSVSLARGATFVRKPGHRKPAPLVDATGMAVKV